MYEKDVDKNELEEGIVHPEEKRRKNTTKLLLALKEIRSILVNM